MKKWTLYITILAGVCTAHAQDLNRIQPSFDDYISLLNASGYEAYAFDISRLKDTTYDIKIEWKEYDSSSHEPVNSKTLAVFNNRTMVKDFMWSELSDEELESIKEKSIDFENGIYNRSDKITVGFLPVINDSSKRCMVNVDNSGSVIFNLSLKGVTDKSNNISYLYDSRPFKISSFEPNTFIPLVLYGSWWYDDNFGVLRFCGESEIDSEMTAKILESIPHYYIIGATFNPKKE